MKYKGNVVVGSLSLKFLEQILTKGTSVVVSIVLARLLAVDDFGVIAILTVFTGLASAIIEGGLSTSLIQAKNVDDIDYSTVFYTSGLLAIGLYGVLYVTAPFIADYYANPDLCGYLRITGLMLFATPFNATQLGYVYKNMMFKHLLISTVSSSLLSGALGIVLAMFGFGVWALVAQTLSASIISVVLLFVIIPWKPKLLFSVQCLKMHFSYGWKLLVASILDTLYIDFQALIIGKKYSSDKLGYYNRGDLYPKTLITSLNVAVQTVMFPVMAAEQDNVQSLKNLIRKSVSMSAHILFPIMAGFAAVGQSFVTIVLTEKWLPCVPYLQLACLAYAVRPINSCNTQAIKAIGRSDIFLWLTLIKKTIGFVVILFTASYFHTPMAIAMGVALYAPIELLINAIPNRKLINYSLKEQFSDIMLPMLASVVMFVLVYAITLLNLNMWLELLLQVISGVAIYVVLMVLCKSKTFYELLDGVKRILKK